MPRSPYRSPENGKRDYRNVEKTSQDRYYNNDPKKKVQRTYEYP
jgi:hypothetical protein